MPAGHDKKRKAKRRSVHRSEVKLAVETMRLPKVYSTEALKPLQSQAVLPEMLFLSMS